MQDHAHTHLGPAGHQHGARPRGADDGIRRRLWIALALVLIYMGAEVVGGLLSGSLALLADAGHMLSDAGSLGLTLFATWFATRPAPVERTYGHHRAEILAALAHGGTLVAVSILIFVEAWERFRAPPQVEGGLLIVIAAGGLVINLAALGILHRGRDLSLNVRGAWLHVISDALGSVQALVAGLLILFFGWDLADPIASVLIGALVAYSAWRLTREAVGVLMEGAPGHLDVDEVRGAIIDVEGVAGVHDLHVWTITSGFVALSAHVVRDEAVPADLLVRITRRLEERFGIRHTTIQIEPADFDACCEECGEPI